MSARADGFVYCRHREASREQAEVLDFGLLDAKGRAIGYRVLRTMEEWTERDDDGMGGRICKPEDLGVWFVAWTHATRNGETFGALTTDLRARTSRELEGLIAARVEGSRARYAKKAGGS